MSIKGDLTRPTPREGRVLQRRPMQIMAWPIGLMVLGAFVVALLVLPLRSWFDQRNAMSSREKELLAYADANAQLAKEIEQLQTPEGIEVAIRTELGYIKPGEQPLTLLKTPEAPASLPNAWPYTVVSNILAIRSTEEANKPDSGGVLNPLAP